MPQTTFAYLCTFLLLWFFSVIFSLAGNRRDISISAKDNVRTAPPATSQPPWLPPCLMRCGSKRFGIFSAHIFTYSAHVLVSVWVCVGVCECVGVRVLKSLVNKVILSFIARLFGSACRNIICHVHELYTKYIHPNAWRLMPDAWRHAAWHT